MDSLDLRNKLGGLNIPVLVVGGDLDDTVGVDNLLLDFLALPANHRFLHMFHSVGHSPNFEIPQELAIVIDEFMDRIS
jgi:pimeloyl-ACP methyl ester carboxylesterase